MIYPLVPFSLVMNDPWPIQGQTWHLGTPFRTDNIADSLPLS